MSDLLIRGMELPENCWSCRMFCNCFACEGYDCHCAALGKDIGTEAEVLRNKRRDDCPLLPVPPHGRLIDADALIEHLEFTMKHCTIEGHTAQRYREMIVELSIAPTIIPAEEAEA